jgi:hypothetical protein
VKVQSRRWNGKPENADTSFGNSGKKKDFKGAGNTGILTDYRNVV